MAEDDDPKIGGLIGGVTGVLSQLLRGLALFTVRVMVGKAIADRMTGMKLARIGGMIVMPLVFFLVSMFRPLESGPEFVFAMFLGVPVGFLFGTIVRGLEVGDSTE